MKKLLTVCLIILFFQLTGIAQNQAESNPVVITTWKYIAPQLQPSDTTFKHFNYDTMLAYYMDKGVRPNNLIKNFRVLGHAWGSGSNTINFVYEIVGGYTNLNKADEKTAELINASFKTEADKNLFWRRFNLVFDLHDDNILTEMVKPKM